MSEPTKIDLLDELVRAAFAVERAGGHPVNLVKHDAALKRYYAAYRAAREALGVPVTTYESFP